MKIDPITLEVVRNRFDVIAEEMQATLLRASFSTIVKEGQDASASLFDPQGDVIAQACAIPAHQGMLIPAVKRIVQAFPPATMQDGDVFVLNDPYDGGTHLPDITIVVPVIADGEVVALSCTMTHHQDVGGKTPGSVPPDATEIFQEGLRIPPLKLYDAGRPNTTLEAIIRRNVRIPDIVMGDFGAQLAAGQVGRQRLLRLFREYGTATVQALVRELFDRAEAMTRAALRRFPEGTYTFTDYLDNDGIELDRRIPIRAAVTLRDTNLIVDFTGTSPQVRGPFNAVPSSVLATVYYVIRAITDPAIPNNAGCFRPVQLHLPPGSLVNPDPPAAVNARSTTIKRIADVLLGALATALPDRIPAAPGGNLLSLPMGGVDPETGRTYVFTHLIAGGMGARPDKDGIDCIETDVTNCMINPVESVEMAFPVRVVQNRLLTDSGGAGRRRGGLGFERTFEMLRGEAVVSHRGDRHYTQPWGLAGGQAAPSWRSVIERAGGGREEVPAKQVFTLREGDRLHLVGAGGAGHGDPLERPAGAVLDDVLDRKVSIEAARDAYGVVIDPHELKVDEDATRRRRADLAARRGPVTWTYDRGALGRE